MKHWFIHNNITIKGAEFYDTKLNKFYETFVMISGNMKTSYNGIMLK